MIRRALLRFALAAPLAATAAGPALAGAETSLDRLRSLLEERRRLEWENDRLKQELAFAATRSPYIVVDLAARTFEFRVRGRTLKTYTAASIDRLGRDGKPLSEEGWLAALGGPLEIQRKAEGPPEIRPPTPVDANAPEDPNAGPVRSDAGILGVDAPLEYDVTLDRDVRIEVRTLRELGRWEKTVEGFSSVGRALSEAIASWTGREEAPAPDAPSAILRVSFDEATTKAFFHSLLPGETVYFRQAPPRPVSLVASLSPAPPAPASPAKPPAGRRPSTPASR